MTTIRCISFQAIEHIPGVSETITYKNFMHAYALGDHLFVGTYS